MKSRATALLLNVAHAIDHMFLLVFATAVGAIAADFGLARWEDLMPFGVGAFALFGLGSLPSGRLGDHWGRRRMMLVFFFGMGASMLLVAATTGPWQLAAALTLMGAFSSIYHPVGIPMLVQGAPRPGLTIGINGLAGNLGVALAAVATGVLVKYAGWRAAFVVPAALALVCGIAFARVAPEEPLPPAQRQATQTELPSASFARMFTVVTVASITASLLFNFTTNGNGELLRERFSGITADPALLGALLAVVYVVGVVCAGRRRLADRPGAVEDSLPVDRRVPGAAVRARRPGAGLGAVRADDRVHGRRIRRDSFHRCDDRPLRR